MGWSATIGFGKRRDPAVESASAAADSTCRLFITDKKTGTRYLIDTGADVSVLPASSEDRKSESFITLAAANRSAIATYGIRHVVVDLGLRRHLNHPFFIADVGSAIIGADFLAEFDLLVDLKRKRLVDGVTGCQSSALLSQVSRLTNVAADKAIEYVDRVHVSTDGIPDSVVNLLRKYPDILRPHFKTKDVKHSVRHRIETNCAPISSKPRRLAADKLKAVKADFEHMVAQGICKRKDSPWSSPLTVVPKPSGEWRSCGDFRALNAATKPDRYPIPHIQDFNQSIGQAKVFGKIDLVRAYHQIPVAPDDVEKTAVTTPFGNFVFFAMPFGLRNAAQTFQRFMDEVVKGLDFVYVYIDDILIFSENEEQHIHHLDQLFDRLNEHGIAINTQKSDFIANEVDFLGFKVSSAGIAPLPAKVEAIVSYPAPKNVKELLRFLGFVNFYRPTVPHAADAQCALYDMTTDCRTSTGKFRNKTLEWSDATRQAFADVKQSLVDAVTLAHPVAGADIALFADASDKAMGASLNQFVNDQWQPLGFFSRRFTDHQKSDRYSAYSRELLAIKEAIAYFRHQVEGREFTVFTDHKPLTSAFTKPNNDALPKTIRDLRFISQFTTDIRHVSGADNVAADALSRIEAIVFNDYTGIADAQVADDELDKLLESDSALNLQRVPLHELQSTHNTRATAASSADTTRYLWVNESHGRRRPYIPEPLRREIFNSIHNTSHPGIRETLRLISMRFVWPDMKRQVKSWATSCQGCQASKVHRHTIPPATTFLVPDERFAHVHMDIIHMPPADGFRYCLTAVDRRNTLA